MYRNLIERLESQYNISLFDDGGEQSAVVCNKDIIVSIYEMSDKSVDILVEQDLEGCAYEELDSKTYKRLTPAYNFIEKYLR